MAAAYAAVFVAVLTGSPLVRFDWRVAMWRPYRQWPQSHGLLEVLVVAGQRGPTATAALAWLGWHSWRSRSPRPLLVFLVALVLLNVSVGAVKVATGRLGPHHAHAIGSSELFRGGDIFPSGHTANSVVIWGTLAYLAQRHRKAAAALSALAAFVVGLITVYLGTHWFSDVLGGWAAGALVLLALPYCEPFVERLALRVRKLAATLSTDPASGSVPAAATVCGVPADWGPRGRDGQGGSRTRLTPVGAATLGFSSRIPAPRRVSPAGAAVAFHPRVWNERGPPRVTEMSQMEHHFSCVPGVSGMNGWGDADRVGLGAGAPGESWRVL
ncbi:phosphatase PAP2 family protein [Streptomyces canus]|uniref:phosphatase PAP2 family protein n=1 Tax=Streptomyces canus TaxID=58343 RepID=UPI0038267EBA